MMRITHYDDNRLQIRFRLPGIFLIGGGAFALTQSFTGAILTGLFFDPMMVILFYAVLALIGLAVISYGVSIYTMTWTFDRAANSLTRQRFVLTKTVVEEYPLSDIVGMQVTRRFHERTIVYRIEMILAHGKRIPLTGIPIDASHRATKKVATAIQEFLDLPESQSELSRLFQF